jgi:hypothetical protein
MQVSSPVTAAGPRRFSTGFPIMPYMGTRITYTTTYMQLTSAVKEKNGPGQQPEGPLFGESFSPGRRREDSASRTETLGYFPWAKRSPKPFFDRRGQGGRIISDKNQFDFFSESS